MVLVQPALSHMCHFMLSHDARVLSRAVHVIAVDVMLISFYKELLLMQGSNLLMNFIFKRLMDRNTENNSFSFVLHGEEYSWTGEFCCKKLSKKFTE